MLRRGLPFATLALALAAAAPAPPAAAAPRGRPTEVLQAPESDRGLVLVVSGRRARAEWRHGRERAPRLRRGEYLVSVADLGRGWVAAGVRPAGTADGATEIFLIEADSGGRRRLRPPAPAAGGKLRLRPVPIVERGRLAGLAWLEGDHPRRAAVVAADWTGAGWGPTRTVSPPGRGSQSGLAAATLGEGSTLLVWSAFDGEDDEILWSRRRGEGWGAPSRLHPGNATPDVTPAVIATRRGALAVWGRLDGGAYRLYSSRFAGGSWSPPRPAAAAGSLFPTLHRSRQGLFLLHWSAAPDGWAVAEIDAEARTLRRALVPAAPGPRPALAASDGEGPTLRLAAGRRRAGAAWSPQP